MTQSFVSLRAGHSALSHIQNNGLKADGVGLLMGASGGPKWFVLQGIDEWLFGEFFANKKAPLNTLGTSAGAWRFASLGQNDPVAASRLFAQLYSHQTYSAKPDQREITSEAEKLLHKYVPESAVSDILSQTRVHHHFIAVRCLRSTASEGRRQALGLLSSALANSVNRRWLGRYYERVVFHHPASDLKISKHWSDLPTRHVALTEQNFQPALLATGSIPLVLEGVRDIPGAPKGVYRDGGITDYHFDIDLSRVNGLTLYPHFHHQAIPGWFDKRLKWRRSTGRDWPNTLFISPTDAFLQKLPYQKIPDRKDFAQLDAPQRIDYWQKAIDAGRWMADELQTLIANGRLGERTQLWD